MGEIAVKVEKVTKIYKLYDKTIDRLKESLKLTKKKCSNDYFALKEISFDINKGETLGIIGTNGAGKSTLLKIITGVLNPTHGSVYVNGRISALLELGAGFNMEYTGIQNIYLNGTMIGFTKEEIDAKLEKILEFADIGEFVYQPVKTYSSGMFVRLAFAISINIDPEILIVDEALSVGDVFFQAKCYKKFEEFKEKGKTIIFVSHDLSSISKFCDRAILLNKGKKISEGKPKEIIDLYKKVLVNQIDITNKKNTQKLDNNTDWKKNLSINPNIVEYGNKLAEIYDFCIVDNTNLITNSIIKGNDFTIKMKIRFNSELQDPIFAFTIKDLKGTELTGTNTMIEKVYFNNPKIDDVKEVQFVQKMTLQGGEYLLSLGCTGYKNGEFVVYHRLYDVCNIIVVADKNTVGFFDLDSYVEVN